MTADDTAAMLILASGGLAVLIKPALKLAFPGRRFGQKTVQPIALAIAALCLVAWLALQPGPIDWLAIIRQAGMGWALAAGIAARPGKPKKEDPPMS